MQLAESYDVDLSVDSSIAPVQVVDSSECGQIICRFPRIEHCNFQFRYVCTFYLDGKNFKDSGVSSTSTQDNCKYVQVISVAIFAYKFM